jgi:transposase
MKENTSETIGCDLGDKKSHLTLVDSQGAIKQRLSVRTTPKAMTAFFTRPPAHVVLEVGAHSRWVSRLLTDLGHQVTIANPRKVKLISESYNKDDPYDSELLGRLGRADVKLLSPIKHRDAQTQADLAVAKARDTLVATRTKLVNHVRATVKSFGHQLPRCDADTFGRHTRQLIPTMLKAALDPIYEVLERIDQQIREQDKMIERVASKYPDVKVISQPKGVGTLTALVYLLTIEDKNRFANSRMAGAYLGLRPRKRKSGEEDPQLRITKAGDPFARRLLVNAANYVMGPFGPDCDLRRWGLELATRGGKNAKKRAKVAVARKLAVLMHRLWVTGEVYEPLGYHQRRTEEKRPAA